jgi:hypothetical protein
LVGASTCGTRTTAPASTSRCASPCRPPPAHRSGSLFFTTGRIATFVSKGATHSGVARDPPWPCLWAL